MNFDDIYKFYFSDVFLYLRSLSANIDTAEELTQETFFKVMQSIKQFDGTKDIKAWIFTIAKNTYIDFCRKEHKKANINSFEQIPDKEIEITKILADKQDAFIIHKILHQLQEPYKEVFSLRVFGELSFESIGKLFDKSSGWARVIYYRAKQKIISHMEEEHYVKQRM